MIVCLFFLILLISLIECELDTSSSSSGSGSEARYSCDDLYEEVDDEGNTKAHKAAMSNDMESLIEISKCKDKSMVLLEENKDGWSPLHIAAKEGHIDVIKLLVDNGADIRLAIYNHDGIITALDIAMNNLAADHEVIDYLRNNVVTKIYEEENILESDRDLKGKAGVAALRGDQPMLERIAVSNHSLLFEADAQGWTPLHDAVLRGHKDVVSFLLNQGADLSLETDSGATALDICNRALESYGEVKHVLLHYVPNQHFYNVSWNIVSLLDDHNHDNHNDHDHNDDHDNVSDDDLHQKLVQAVVENDIFSIMLMTTTSKYNQITSSIINKVDNNGWSVLHEAVRSKSIISIKILLDKGADKYKVNNAGDNSINLVNQFIRKFEKLLELLRKHIFLQSYSWKVAKLLMTAEL